MASFRTRVVEEKIDAAEIFLSALQVERIFYTVTKTSPARGVMFIATVAPESFCFSAARRRDPGVGRVTRRRAAEKQKADCDDFYKHYTSNEVFVQSLPDRARPERRSRQPG